jgi:virulence-associated protein VagC
MEIAMNARIPASALQPTASKVASVFTSGNSQAVRIPKEFQIKTKQVTIVQRGGELVIRPKYRTGAEVLANLPPVDTENLHEWEAFDKTIRALRNEPAQERDWNTLFGEDESKALAKSRAPKKPTVNAGKSLKPVNPARKTKGAKTP